MVVGLMLCAASMTAQAQVPAPAGGARDVEANALNCWWAPAKSAVHVGEPFGLTLTCRVLETEAAAVVPNVAEIEPTSIQLTPFDVLEGRRHEDVVVPPWRYLQFSYTVRLLGEEFFGRDLSIPSINVTFRIRTGGADATEGTERSYVLPSIPIRILSLVPAQAADIRDPAPGTFADAEALRVRSTVALVAGVILLGFAALLLAIAMVHAIERYRKRAAPVEAPVPVGALLDGCLREVDRVRSEAARDGWSPGLAARALAPFRVAAAVAMSQPVTQTMVAGGAPTRDGQLAVGYGVLRRRHARMSAAMTADAIDRLRTADNGNAPCPVNDDLVDPIRDVLVGLNAVRYGRSGAADVLELDRTLDNGASALRRLRGSRRWHSRAAAALTKSAASIAGAWGR
jgi:hypothetical protein